MIHKVILANILMIAAVLICSIAVFSFFKEWVHPYYFEALVFVFFLMTLSYIVLFRVKEHPEKFISWFMILLVARFLIVGVGFLVLSLVGVENIRLLVINFFIVYFAYLVFEIIQLLPNLRANS